MRLTRLYPGTIVKPAVRTILVPRPTTALVGGQPLRDTELLSWAADLVNAVLLARATDGADRHDHSPPPAPRPGRRRAVAAVAASCAACGNQQAGSAATLGDTPHHRARR